MDGMNEKLEMSHANPSLEALSQMSDAEVSLVASAVLKEAMPKPTAEQLWRLQQAAFLKKSLEAKLADIRDKKSPGEWFSGFYSSNVTKVFSAIQIEKMITVLGDAEKQILSGKKVSDLFTSLQLNDLKELGFEPLLHDSRTKTISEMQSRYALNMMREFRGYDEARSFVEDYYFKDQFAKYRKILDENSFGKSIEKKASDKIDSAFKGNELEIKSQFREQVKVAGKNASEADLDKMYKAYIDSSKEELALRMKNTAVAHNVKNFTTKSRFDVDILDAYKRVVGVNESGFSDQTSDMLVDEFIVNAPLIMVSGFAGTALRAGVTRLVASNALRYGDKLAKLGLYADYGKKGERAIKSIGSWGDIVMGSARLGGLGIESAAFTATSSTLSGEISKMSGMDFINATLHNAAVLGSFKFGGKVGNEVSSMLINRYSVAAKKSPLIAKIVELAVHGSAEMATMLVLASLENAWARKELNLYLDERDFLHALITVGALNISRGVVKFAGKEIAMPVLKDVVSRIGAMRESVKSKIKIDGVSERSEQSQEVAGSKLNKQEGGFLKEAMSDITKLEGLTDSVDTINLSLKNFQSLSEAVTKSKIPNKGEVLMAILMKMPSVARLATKANIEKVSNMLANTAVNNPKLRELGIKASEIRDALLRNKRLAGVLSAIMLYPKEVFAASWWVQGSNFLIDWSPLGILGVYGLFRMGSELSLRGVSPLGAAVTVVGGAKVALTRAAYALVNKAIGKNADAKPETAVSDDLNRIVNKMNRVPGNTVGLIDNLATRVRNSFGGESNDSAESISRRGKVREMYNEALRNVESIAREIDKLIAEEPVLTGLRVSKKSYAEVLRENLENFKKLGDVDKMNDHIYGLKTRLNALRNSLKEFRESKAKAAGVDPNVFAKFETARTSVKNAAEALKNTKKALKEQRKLLVDATQELASVEKDLVKADSKVADAIAKKDSLFNEHTELSDRYQYIENNLIDYKRELSSLESLGDTATKENLEKIKELKNAISDVNKILILQGIEIKKIADKLREAEKKVTNLTEKRDNLNSKKGDLEVSSKDKGDELKNLETNLTNAKTALTNAQRSLTAAKSARDNASQAIKGARGVDLSAGKKAELEAATTARDALKAEFKTLETEYDYLHTEFEELKSNYEDAESEYENAKKDLEESKKSYDDFSDKADLAEGDRLKKAYEDAEKKHEALSNSSSNLKEKYEVLIDVAKVGDVLPETAKRRLDEAALKQSTLENEIATLEKGFLEAKSKYNRAIELEKGLIDELAVDKKSARDVLETKKTIATDKGAFEALTESIKILRNNLESAKMETFRLKVLYYKVLEGKRQLMQSKLKGLESNIDKDSTVNAKLNAIKDQLTNLKEFAEGPGNINEATAVEILKSQKWRRLAGDLIVAAALWHGSGLVASIITNHREAVSTAEGAAEATADATANAAKVDTNKKILDSIDPQSPSPTPQAKPKVKSKQEKNEDELLDDIPM